MQVNYTYFDNNEGGKTLKISKSNGLIIMNLHESAEGHKELIEFLGTEDNLKKYVEYLSINPDRAFNITEILAL